MACSTFTNQTVKKNKGADGMPAYKTLHLATIARDLAKTDARSALFSDSLELWFVHKMCIFSSPLLLSSSLLGCRFPACLPEDRRRKPNPPEPNVAQITKQSCICLLSFHSAVCAGNIELHSLTHTHTHRKRWVCVCVCFILPLVCSGNPLSFIFTPILTVYFNSIQFTGKVISAGLILCMHSHWTNKVSQGALLRPLTYQLHTDSLWTQGQEQGGWKSRRINAWQ